MFDDDKTMNVQVICNQPVVVYNRFLGMNTMVFIATWADYKNKQLFTNMKI